ncbi:MAG: hypothetical protein V4677_02695 [Bacteroidota bacterium]
MIKHILFLSAFFSVLILHFFNSPTKHVVHSTNDPALILSDTILKIERNPSLGFNFAYYLRIPKGLDQNEIQYLLAETNNSGSNDTMLHHEKETYLETTRRSLGGSLCTKLKLPLLMPIFPRPATQWQLYTHAFDRDVASIKEGELKRLDLQLIAMIEHAKTVLKKRGINSKDKFLMNGFSASGTFANRFTLIHPTLVAGTACGGINAIPILCIDKLEKTELKYPIGTSDFEPLFGTKVNLEEYKKVPQFIYMGQNDKNDAVLYDDAYSKPERKLIFKLLGQQLIPERFSKCESIYVQNNVNCTFKVYPGIGHETDRKVLNEVSDFFMKIIAQK